MSEPAAKKRARIEVEEDIATPDNLSVEAGSAAHTTPDHSPRKRDEEFWFEDGNVILVARNVEFRFYQGILSAHSPIFKTMFTLPQPPSNQPSMCPEVTLLDSPEDLRHILRIYMPHDDFSPFEKPSFDMISSTIRLGHKYEMHKLVDHSVAYLKSRFPSDFDVWRKLDGCVPPYWTFVNSIGVVNLARLAGERSLLLTALFTCCVQWSVVAEECSREDGTVENLSPEDLGRCFGAQKKLVEAHIASLVRIFRPFSCGDGVSSCRQELQKTLMTLDKYIMGLTALEPFLHLPIFDNVKKALCRKCWKVLLVREDEERRDNWGRLPSIFGLEIPGWNDD